MRRKSSNEQYINQQLYKQQLNKRRSPILKKNKSKTKIELTTFLQVHKNKSKKLKDDLSKYESKGDSYNSTATTNNKSKIVKNSKKIFEREGRMQKRQSKNLEEGDIMDIINHFVKKIQRQWRVYQMRKKFKELIIVQRLNRRKKVVLRRQASKIQLMHKPQLDTKKIVNFQQFQVSQQGNQEITTAYNHQKYQISSSQVASSRQVVSERPSDRSPIKIVQLQAKQEPIIQSKDIDRKKEARRSFDNLASNKQKMQNRRHSTGEMEFVSQSRKEVKVFTLDKVYQIKIGQQAVQEIQKSKLFLEVKNKSNQKNQCIKRGQNDKNAFNVRYPFDRVFSKCKKALEVKKLKKLLSIENRFSKNEMTFRSYQNFIQKIDEQHKCELEKLRIREGQMKNNWTEIFKMYKSSLGSEVKFFQDQRISDREDHHLSGSMQMSMSFDKWDFNSSAKKSMDSNFDILSEVGNQGKVFSIESVLRSLDECDDEKWTEAPIEEKNFQKKMKSLKVIEAIAERSKQVSEKDLDSFHEQQQLALESDIKEKQTIKIDEQQIPNKEQKSPIKKPQQAKQSKFLQLSLEITDKKNEYRNESQSFIASRIQAYSACDGHSQKSLTNTEQKNLFKDILFRDFKESYSTQKEVFKNIEADSGIRGQQLINCKKDDQLFDKFMNLVNQKMVLNNVKILNSLKFIFVKGSQEKTRKKNYRQMSVQNFPSIQADINSINTWLLQISHFILDNYQQVIKDNLINLKQPPSKQLLICAQKNEDYVKLYQTIPQYVFKDFEFYYIKTLSKNSGVSAEKYDNFSTLLYTFHRSLVDSLNLSLLAELITGKRWLCLPWKNQFRKKKKIENEHAKQCLQKSINIVSNWGEYGMARLHFEDQLSQIECRQYEQEKMNLVCRQQVFQFDLRGQFAESHLLLLITQKIFEQQLTLIASELFSIQRIARCSFIN